MKFKIVKKQKDGVYFTPVKGAKPVKISWKELEEGYLVDGTWAISNKQMTKTLDIVFELIDNVVNLYKKSEKDPELGSEYSTSLSYAITKIQELTGWGNFDIINQIDAKINDTKSPKKHNNKKSTSKKEKPVKKDDSRGFAILTENPELLKLKEQLEGK